MSIAGSDRLVRRWRYQYLLWSLVLRTRLEGLGAPPRNMTHDPDRVSREQSLPHVATAWVGGPKKQCSHTIVPIQARKTHYLQLKPGTNC